MIVKERSRHLRTKFTRRRTLEDLIESMGRDNVRGAEACITRLLDTLPNQEQLSRNVVMVPYGGGKDSSFIVAMARLAQLVIHREEGDTFRLRSVTNWQPGMAYGVLDNIDRVYNKLGLIDEPMAELLFVEGNRVLAFDPAYKMSSHLLEANRRAVLDNGHQTRGCNRTTFCNECNFGMENSFKLGLQYDRPADIVITGDSPREQRMYVLWMERMRREMGVERKGEERNFGTFMQVFDSVAETYLSSVHGADSPEAQERRVGTTPLENAPQFFSMFEDLRYEAGAHWSLLTEYLGFEFHDLAFSFTESDCANPALMCHLRGLRLERLRDQPYHDGVAQYRDWAIGLMHKKKFPEVLIQTMADRYRDPDAMNQVRRRVESYARSIFNLSEEQLVCMIFSPFTENAKHLEEYLKRERSDFLSSANAIRAVLSGTADPAADETSRMLAGLLENWSGVSLEKLKWLFTKPLVDNTVVDDDHSTSSPIRIMFRHDPHQGPIKTRYRPGEPEVTEIESGR